MTVITMTSSEKKADNVPLVTNIEIDPSAIREKDIEAGGVNGDNARPSKSKFLVLRVINHSVYSMWALVYVVLMSLLITIMMLYGEHIYRAIGNAFVSEESPDVVPVSEQLNFPDQNSNEMEENLSDFNKIENFALQLEKLTHDMMEDKSENNFPEFKGDFELGLRDDSYEKIEPTSPINNGARFIHDFSANATAIIDIEGKQCFVMPLDRSAVEPPTGLFDLLNKMTTGYYTVDTKSVMHNMRVVKPAIENLNDYGVYIASDCKDFPTYKLEKIVSGVFKRSAPSGKKTFSVFSGQLDTFNIVNYYDINSQ